jgi:hypothetical protein
LEHLGNLDVQALLRGGQLHASLDVGRHDDPVENEADRMADRVMQMGTPSPAPNAQRGNAPGSSSSSLGGGKPLDAAERSFFEPRFGVSFEGVRIHTGPQAAQSAATVRASAYTVGSDVVFGQGRYQPGNGEGKRLLAHELAHVAQSRAPGAKSATPVIRRAPLQADGVVLYDDTEVFKAPARNYKDGVLSKLAKDTRVEVTGEVGDFYQVTAGATSGFVLRRKVDLPAALDEKYRPEPNRRIVPPAAPQPANTPVTPPAGWKIKTPTVHTVAISDDVVAQRDPYKSTPIGTQIFETVDGEELLFIPDWHRHPDTPEERARLEKTGQLGLLNWHRGCSSYEKIKP